MRSSLAALLGLSTVLVACGGGGDDVTPDPDDHPPVAVDDVATTSEDQAITIPVLANDRDDDGQALVVRGATAAGHAVTFTARDVTVTPAPDFHGTIVVDYELGAGLGRATAAITLTVTPVNDVPVATHAVVATGRNAPRNITLAGIDVDGDTLTYEVTTAPAHGTLSGAGSQLRYTPARDYVGPDVVSFQARDAVSSSANATIDITVAAGQGPVAEARTASTTEDVAVAVTLAGSDPDGDALTFAVTVAPQHGVVSGTPPNVIYTPQANYDGTDSFSYTAYDGVLTSAPAAVTVTMTPVNDAPYTFTQPLTTAEDVALPITLIGLDIDSGTLTYTITAAPTLGTLTGTGDHVTYTPAPNQHGTDSLTFTVSDGALTSAPATIAITVTPVPDAPVATAQTVNAIEDVARPLVLAGTDDDGDPLTYAVTALPAHGALTGTPPAIVYTPVANYNGPDSLTFTVRDATQISAPVTVPINVVAVNDPPTLSGAALTTAEGVQVAIPLVATDVDGDALTLTVVTFPAHGYLYGTGLTRMYGPSGYYNGPDQFALAVSDGAATSAAATFTVTITPVPTAPFARDDLGIVTPGAPFQLDVLANDSEVDGEAMTIQAVGTATHGVVTIENNQVVYAPTPGVTTPDAFTYTVVDTGGLTATATVRLGIGEFPGGLVARRVGRVVHYADTWNQVLQQDVSTDGRYVALLSPVALTPGDTNGVADVYVFDRMTLTFQRISVGVGNALADAASERPSISGDGRYVAFASAATNLVAGDTNGAVDVFVRDRVAGTTVRASVGPGGVQVNGVSRAPDLSADGAVVAFTSTAFELVPDDANGASDVFVRDLAAGVTTRVSVRGDGGEADLASLTPAISGNGRFVAFVSAASNLVAGDTNADPDVFVRDRVAGTTERASVSSTGIEANNSSSAPVLSYDGRFVAFVSSATNLVSGSTAGGTFVRDRQSVTTTAGAGYASAVTLSADGRYLAGFTSSGSCFVRDRFAAVTHTFAGVGFFPVISANGRYVAVLSNTDLTPTNSGAIATTAFLLPNPL